MFPNLYLQTTSNHLNLPFSLKEIFLIKRYQIIFDRVNTFCISLFILPIIHIIQDQTPFIEGIQITNFITPYTLLPHAEIIQEEEFQEFYLNSEEVKEESQQNQQDQQEIFTKKISKTLLDIIEQQYQNYQTINPKEQQKLDSQIQAEEQFNQNDEFNDQIDDDAKYYKFLSLKENKIGFQDTNDYLKQTRRTKVERYFIKKQRRNWKKKISYFCRKQVADSRLRIKGRFITRDQVTKMFNINTTNLTIEEIKQFIEAKLNSKEELETGESQFSEDFKMLA